MIHQPNPKPLIAYYRVSTDKQGRSGLGLDAQRACVADYARHAGATILRSYQEVESGKRSDRPELMRAIADAKRSKAVLVIAKFDRLARNVHFLSGLMRSGVDFVACDNPHANKLTIHILAAVAESEADMISERTRAAMAVARARGVRFGTPANLTPAGRARGAAMAARVHRERAEAAYADLVPIVRGLRAEGLSLREIARRLNDDGHCTRHGAAWNQVQVRRLLNRPVGSPP